MWRHLLFYKLSRLHGWCCTGLRGFVCSWLYPSLYTLVFLLFLSQSPKNDRLSKKKVAEVRTEQIVIVFRDFLWPPFFRCFFSFYLSICLSSWKCFNLPRLLKPGPTLTNDQLRTKSKLMKKFWRKREKKIFHRFFLLLFDWILFLPSISFFHIWCKRFQSSCSSFSFFFPCGFV